MAILESLVEDILLRVLVWCDIPAVLSFAQVSALQLVTSLQFNFEHRSTPTAADM